jgi:hypothetical protein
MPDVSAGLVVCPSAFGHASTAAPARSRDGTCCTVAARYHGGWGDFVGAKPRHQRRELDVCH